MRRDKSPQRHPNGEEAEGSGRRSRPGLAVSALLGGKGEAQRTSPTGSAGGNDGAKREDEDGYGQLRRPMSRSSPRQISTASSKGDGGAAMVKGNSRSTASPGAGDDISHEGNSMAYQYTAVQQILENRENVEYQLTIREQPKHSRMCGVGEKADRRPIDPAPIIQLRVITHDGPGERRTSTDSQSHEAESRALSRRISNGSSGVRRGVPVTTPQGPGWEDKAWYLENPYYFMYAMLADAETDEELHLLSDGKTRYTAGSCVSCLYHLKDIDGSHQGFFVFPDLSIRVEGRYRLKLCLFETIGQEVHHCKSIYSSPFSVYTAKRFPGMTESTLLSRSFADQGLKVRVRKNPRARRNRAGKRKSDGLSDDDSDDGGGYGRYPEGPGGDPYAAGGRELKRVKSGPEPRGEPIVMARYDDGYGQPPPQPAGAPRPRSYTHVDEWDGQRRYAGEPAPPARAGPGGGEYQERERAMAARERGFSNPSRGYREPIPSEMPYYPSQPPPPPFMPGGHSRGPSPPPPPGPGPYPRPGGPPIRARSPPGLQHSHSTPALSRPPHESPEARHATGRFQAMPPAPGRGGLPPPGYPRDPVEPPPPSRMRGPPPGEYMREEPPYRDDPRFREEMAYRREAYRDEPMPYRGDPYREERYREQEGAYYGRGGPEPPHLRVGPPPPGGPEPPVARRGYAPPHEAGPMPPLQRAREVLPPPPPQTQVRRLSGGGRYPGPDVRPYESLPPPPGPRGVPAMPPAYGDPRQNGPPSPQHDRYGRSYPGQPQDISPRLPPPPPHGAPLAPPRTSSRRGPPH